MISLRVLTSSILCAALFSAFTAAQDLSKYRDFEFGMSLESVAKLAHTNLAGARMVHQRPAVMQTLDWDLHGYFDASPSADSVRSIRFDFYNGELFKMLVTYDPAQTRGLTADDLIESLSVVYGPAGQPGTNIVVSGFLTYNDSEQILARWETTQYSYNLFRSSYGNSFGLVAFSKPLESMAAVANQEAQRLDKLEGPARESARQKKQEEDERTSQEKDRLINKPRFRL
jgi:hypothetical protein